MGEFMIIIDDYKMRLNKFREDMANLYDALKIDAVGKSSAPMRRSQRRTVSGTIWSALRKFRRKLKTPRI